MPPRPERVSVSQEHIDYFQNVGKAKWNELQHGLFSPSGNFTKKVLFMKN